MIGVCGAHRTGKTTLAKAFAEGSGLPFVQTSASQVFADMGLDPKVDYPLEQRIEVQRRILDACAKQYRSIDGGIFITDRTPIDMMAYTLADIRREGMTPEREKLVEDYLKECIDVSNATFSILMVVQPGIPLVDEPGKAPVHPTYIEHINALIMGITVSEIIESAHYYIPRKTLDLGLRVQCLAIAIKRTNERFERHKAQLKELGTPMVFH